MNAAQALAEHGNLPRRLARSWRNRFPEHMEVDDLAQAGLIGLLDAATRFEESRGFKFETYASQRIRGAMLDETRRCSFDSRRAAANDGTCVDNDAVDQAISDVDVVEECATRERHAALVNAIGRLCERDQEIINALLAGDTQTEVAARHHISTARCGQLVARIVERLRGQLCT